MKKDYRLLNSALNKKIKRNGDKDDSLDSSEYVPQGIAMPHLGEDEESELKETQ